MKHECRRLVIRPGAIGDCLVSFPAIESLAPAEVWIPSQLVPLVRFARCCSLAASGLDRLGIPGVGLPPALLPRLQQFDSIVSWYGTEQPEFRQAAARLGLPFHFLPALPPDGAGRHAVDFYLEQTRPFRIYPTEPIPAIRVLRSARDTVVIHPFSGSRKKNWPLEYFRELAGRLPLPVEWCCGPEEELPGVAKFDNLEELAGWIAGARFYIGNDSGISHLAAAAGTPSVVLFGPTDPAIWAPRGRQVRVIEAPGGRLEDLQPYAVRDAIDRLLLR